MAKVRILYEPGWFFGGLDITVYVDDEVVHHGGFKTGIDTTLDLAPGSHDLRIALGPRSREYDLEVGDAPEYLAQVRYSRLWGNFTSSLKLEPQ